jgi:hypothetical protein
MRTFDPYDPSTSRPDEDAQEYDPADFKSWVRMPFWTSREAAELSLRIEPTTANHLKDAHPVSVRIARLQRHIERAMSVGQLPGKPERVSPVDFVCWAEKHSIDLPRSLQFGVPRKCQERSAVPDETADSGNDLGGADRGCEEPIPTRARNTLLRMILGMAIKKYRYRPNDRSGAARSISDDLEILGLQVSDDTVRKWLDEAVTELEFNLSRIESPK